MHSVNQKSGKRGTLRGRTQDVVDGYRGGLTMQQLADRHDVSRTAIWMCLRKAGVAAAEGTQRQVTCAYCGVEFIVPRSRARRSRLFCSAEHYYAALGSSNWRPWRQGSRLARAIVAQHFPLEPQHIVHHVDGDQTNNDRSNLWVFASQADHMAHHRGRKVVPLWVGGTEHERCLGLA